MDKVTPYIEAFIEKYRDKRIYLAVSGGIDSMVLLHAVSKIPDVDLKVLHMNYGLRGEESDGDQELVEHFCVANSIDFEIRKVNLKEELESGGNLQQIARNMRYQWFHEKINSEHAIVALAHHVDDQIETFFINLNRKSGVLGLSGMLEEHKGIVRPLLHLSRKDIEMYAHDFKISWRDDSSNAQLKYTRNAIRHALLPELRDLTRDLNTDILVLMSAFQNTQLEIEKSVGAVFQTINANKRIDAKTWKSLSGEEQFELLRQLNISSSFLNEIDKLFTAQKGKKIKIDERNTLIRELDGIHFVKSEGMSEWKLLVEEVESLPEKFNKDSIYLDADKVSGELRVRKWEIGDRISSLGLAGSQLISDVITDAKILHRKRSEILVVHDDQQIHWVPGLKIGRNAIAAKASNKILRIDLLLL